MDVDELAAALGKKPEKLGYCCIAQQSSVRSWHTVVCLSHDQAGGEAGRLEPAIRI
jgi:hypothetical protein